MSRYLTRRTGWLAGGAALLALTAGIYWITRPARTSYYTDAAAIREPVEAALPREALWQPPVELPSPIRTDDDAYEPRYSEDGTTLWFVRGKAGGSADLYFATRTADGWSEPTAPAELNTRHDELGPHPALHGQALYFYSDRPGGQGGYDLWLARKGVEGWQTPINLGPAVNSPFNEYGPAPAPDGRALYFSSNRPTPQESPRMSGDGWPATLREELQRRPYDLYVSALTEDGPVQAAPLDGLNTRWSEGAACVSPVGDFLYFASDRPGGTGGFDLYRARLIRGAPQRAENLGGSINSPDNELDPALTLDGFALTFSSNRPAGERLSGVFPPYRLFGTSSREVFRETQTQVNPFPAAAVWSALWPNLAFALLSLLALIALVKLWKYSRGRRLSLLLRCLLVSMFAHLLVFMLMSFWEVSTTLVSAVRGEGGGGEAIRVALGPSDGSSMDGLYVQLRGALTDISPPSSEALDVSRVGEAPTVDAHIVQVQSQPAPAPLPAEAPMMTLSAGVADSTPRPIAADVARIDAQIPPSAPRADRLGMPAQAAPTTAADPAEERREGIAVAAGRAAPVAGSLAPDVESSSAVSTPPGGAMLESADASFVANAPALDARPGIAGRATEAAGDALRAPELQPRAPQQLAVRSPAAGATGGGASQSEEKAARATPVPGGSGRSNTAGEGFKVGFEAAPPAATGLPPGGSATDGMAEASLASTGGTRDAAVNPSSIGTLPSTTPLAPPQHGALALHTPGPERASTVESGSAVEATGSPVPLPATRGPSIGEPVMAAPSPASIDLGTFGASQRPLPAPFDGAMPMALTGSTGPKDAAVSSKAWTAPAERATAPRPAPLKLTLGLPTADETEPQPTVPQPPIEAIGRIQGQVRDAIAGKPLTGSTIKLDVIDGTSLTAVADEEGRYALEIPQMPDNFVITASRDGYVPSSQNVPVRRLKRGVLTLDFALEPITANVLAMDANPDVHHLGNDRFEGAINSQFQKQAEGIGFVAEFDIAAGQIPSAATVAELRLMAKGVQCPPRIEVNGRRLRYEFEESPSDGGFGEKSIRFDAGILIEGANVIEISTTSCRGDLDDFEFINLQVRLYKSW